MQKMFWKRRNFFANFFIGGSLGTFILSIILATVVFDKPSDGTDAYVPEIEMAMVADPLTQHSEAWIDAVFPMHVTADISKVKKVDHHGIAHSGSMSDLFPSNGPATGRGTINFKIKFIDKSEIPSFENMTLKMMPMFYIRQTSLTEFDKSMFKFSVVFINNMKLITYVIILWSFALILGGCYLVYRQKMRNKPRVKKIIESPVNIKEEMPPNSLLVP